MWITHSYVGTTKNGVRCLFFMLLEDYFEEQTQFARELNLELERFARNLGDSAAVVRPFSGDIEQTRQGVLDKNWTPEEFEEIEKTPSLLMISTDFDEFDPQEHPWVLFNLGSRIYEGVPGAYRFRDPLAAITDAVANEDVDPFEVAHRAQHEIEALDALKVFEAKPGLFGFSVDLVKAGEVVAKVFKRYTR